MPASPATPAADLDEARCLATMREVIAHEALALTALRDRIDDRAVAAARLVLSCAGRVVVSGMGKAGLVGQKISATLASTGTPSHVLHPAEAVHGDLGRLVRDDLVILLSNSGETEEVVRLIPHLKRTGCRLVAITGRRGSTLAQHADVVLDIGDLDEACPLGMAPSTSTTAMLALGDALALAVQAERRFTIEEYARFHPGGSLGRSLLKVGEIMRQGERSPTIGLDRSVKEALLAITRARAGSITVVDPDGRIAGIFTDGDLRRHMAEDLDLGTSIGQVMTRSPVTIGPDQLASEAARVLQDRKIDELPVVDPGARPVGMVDVQDLLQVGLL
jgi:arabinose-5-phosphate isomerase